MVSLLQMAGAMAVIRIVAIVGMTLVRRRRRLSPPPLSTTPPFVVPFLPPSQRSSLRWGTRFTESDRG